ncbi:hypothetical protein RRSWK_05502 [Rhodopirellula sp. SWK7]|nr:hypothetical protein RRSWK_05502 [Rhodopirellula sp. SWK7]
MRIQTQACIETYLTLRNVAVLSCSAIWEFWTNLLAHRLWDDFAVAFSK